MGGWHPTRLTCQIGPLLCTAKSATNLNPGTNFTESNLPVRGAAQVKIAVSCQSSIRASKLKYLNARKLSTPC